MPLLPVFVMLYLTNTEENESLLNEETSPYTDQMSVNLSEILYG